MVYKVEPELLKIFGKRRDSHIVGKEGTKVRQRPKARCVIETFEKLIRLIAGCAELQGEC